MSSQTADRGDLLVRAGAIVFAFGSIATIVTFVPLFFSLHPFPSFAYWLCMLMPLGFLISLTGLLGSARAQKRRAGAAAQPQTAQPQTTQPQTTAAQTTVAQPE